MQFQGSRFTSECSSSFQNAAPSVKIHIMIQLQVSKFRSEPWDAGHDRAKGFRCDLKFQDSHQDSAHLSKLQFQVARFTIKVQLHVSTCSYKLQVTRVALRSSSAFQNAVARFLLHTRIKLQVPRCSSEVQDSCPDPAQCFQMQLKSQRFIWRKEIGCSGGKGDLLRGQLYKSRNKFFRQPRQRTQPGHRKEISGSMLPSFRFRLFS